MDAKALTPRDLFDGKVIYEVPSFQRPYVWTEEDQWQPLWNDIQRVAEMALAVSEPMNLQDPGGHFLGAVVLKQLESQAGEPGRWSVIDGQQRLTTLQILLDAAHSVVEQYGEEDDAEALAELVKNGSKRFAGTEKRFKLWPARVDRRAFEAVMDDEMAIPADLEDSRVVQAHQFFRDAIVEWADLSDSPQGTAHKLSVLTTALEQALQLVAISLGTNDDDQLIFETLNDRGTPLLAADLIKNFIFDRCEKIGADVDRWADRYWLDFDSDWWREQVSQGRLYRSRIDLFIQYWLTIRTLSEIPTDSVFSRFREFAQSRLVAIQEAEDFVRQLKQDGETFRELTDLSPDSASGSFYFRVVEALELGAFIPLLLWLISDRHHPAPAQIDRALRAVESWAVRRTLLRRTMKDVNKMVVALLQDVSSHPPEEVGDATVAFLMKQTADAREWPRDEVLVGELPNIKLYGNIKQQRLRTILAAVEMHLRTLRHEAVALPTRLELEHILPRGWRVHWGEGIRDDPERSTNRDRLTNTLGNLTLVTQKLNVALSNRPWTDEEASLVAPTGKDAGLGKRALLGRYSLLVLNKEIVDGHPRAWTEEDLRARSRRLAEVITEVWPR